MKKGPALTKALNFPFTLIADLIRKAMKKDPALTKTLNFPFTLIADLIRKAMKKDPGLTKTLAQNVKLWHYFGSF